MAENVWDQRITNFFYFVTERKVSNISQVEQFNQCFFPSSFSPQSNPFSQPQPYPPLPTPTLTPLPIPTQFPLPPPTLPSPPNPTLPPLPTPTLPPLPIPTLFPLPPPTLLPLPSWSKWNSRLPTLIRRCSGRWFRGQITHSIPGMFW